MDGKHLMRFQSENTVFKNSTGVVWTGPYTIATALIILKEKAIQNASILNTPLREATTFELTELCHFGADSENGAFRTS